MRNPLYFIVAIWSTSRGSHAPVFNTTTTDKHESVTHASSHTYTCVYIYTYSLGAISHMPVPNIYDRICTAVHKSTVSHSYFLYTFQLFMGYKVQFFSCCIQDGYIWMVLHYLTHLSFNKV